MLKKWIVCGLLAVFVVGCGGTLSEQPTTVSAGGTGDGDALVSVGKIVSKTAEVGFTTVAFAEPEATAYTVGPYAMYLIPVSADIAEDWQPFAGGAMLMDLQGDFDFIPKLAAGVIYKPTDALSPYMMVEKAWPSDSVDSPNIGRDDGVYTWAGLRYRFK